MGYAWSKQTKTVMEISQTVHIRERGSGSGSAGIFILTTYITQQQRLTNLF